ncbi:MAG TPA: ABC transporter permease [Vicinamibacterales bacterium]|jgi:predicted permease|nr:ABC transporter permease [Vicinamibacterales bacterium]
MPVLDSLARDVRYAVRVLRKSPLFALTAIATLGLCIGANTAIYTVVDRVLLRPLPYPRPDRLAMVVRHYEGAGTTEDDPGQAGVTWVALQEGAARALDIAATAGGAQGVNFVAGEHAEYVQQQRVSAGYFRVLGIRPEAGREFSAEEDRANGPTAVILSHAFWAHAFQADPAVIGRRLTIRGEAYTAVGIMPASFQPTEPVDLWTPLRPSPVGEGGGENYEIVGRLRDGVGWPEANAAVASSTAQIVRDRYSRDRSGAVDVHLRVVPLQTGQANHVREPLMIVWAAVGVVLLIGCVNIAGLLLARSAARAPEIATRIALGGGRAAIVRQLLTESVLLASCGGLLGLAIGYAGIQVASALLEHAIGVGGNMSGDGVNGFIALDARVLLITGAAALLTSVVFGLLPALQASRVNLRQTLVEAGSPSIAGSARSWPRRIMVAVEVALGVVLLVAAGLLIRTFDHLVGQRAGFDATHVMTATLSLQDARYQSAEKVNQLFDRSLERIRSLPGVESASACLTLPYERALNIGGRWVSAKPGAPPLQLMNLTYVAGPYFETLRIPLVRGRYLQESDTVASSPVVVVNQTFVRVNSPDEDPIGREIASFGVPRRIVGIVGDIQQKAGFGNYGPVGTMPATYVPAAQTNDALIKLVHTWFSPSWFVRVTTPPLGIVPEMRKAMQAVDPLLPFSKFRTIDELRSEAVATQQAQAALLGALAGLALLLAGVGLYGLVASSVVERTRELGIRMALGASTRRAVAAAAAPGVILAIVGVASGLAAGRLMASLLQHMVWGVSVGDPLAFAAAGAAVLVVSSVAALVPSLRIVRLNPIKALRQ